MESHLFLCFQGFVVDDTDSDLEDKPQDEIEDEDL